MVKVGDKIPDVDLDESSPGDKVNLSKELTGKGVIIGVPAAFSETFLMLFFLSSLIYLHLIGPSCSATHVPGYTSSDKLKDAGQVFVISVNDAFV